MTIMSGVSSFPGDPSPVPPRQYMGIATFILHPFSRGRFHISGPSIKVEPVLDTGFWVENDLDLTRHMWMHKKSAGDRPAHGDLRRRGGRRAPLRSRADQRRPWSTPRSQTSKISSIHPRMTGRLSLGCADGLRAAGTRWGHAKWPPWIGVVLTPSSTSMAPRASKSLISASCPLMWVPIRVT